MLLIQYRFVSAFFENLQIEELTKRGQCTLPFVPELQNGTVHARGTCAPLPFTAVASVKRFCSGAENEPHTAADQAVLTEEMQQQQPVLLSAKYSDLHGLAASLKSFMHPSSPSQPDAPITEKEQLWKLCTRCLGISSANKGRQLLQLYISKYDIRHPTCEHPQKMAITHPSTRKCNPNKWTLQSHRDPHLVEQQMVHNHTCLHEQETKIAYVPCLKFNQNWTAEHASHAY